MFPQLKVRAATPEDLPYLQHRLALKPRNEQVNLRQMIVFIAEYDGVIVGFTGARLMWQWEPMMLFDEFKRLAPKAARRRATVMLAHQMESWIADRTKNHSGIHSYFCFIRDRMMQRMAVSFNMLRIYTGGKFFGKDL